MYFLDSSFCHYAGILIVKWRTIFIANAQRDMRVNGTMKIDNISQSGVTMKSITIIFRYSDQLRLRLMLKLDILIDRCKEGGRS